MKIEFGVLLAITFVVLLCGCTFVPIEKCSLEREVRIITAVKDITISSSFLDTATRCIYETDKGDVVARGKVCELGSGAKLMKIIKPKMTPDCSMPIYSYGYWVEYEEIPFGWDS